MSAAKSADNGRCNIASCFLGNFITPDAIGLIPCLPDVHVLALKELSSCIAKF